MAEKTPEKKSESDMAADPDVETIDEAMKNMADAESSNSKSSEKGPKSNDVTTPGEDTPKGSTLKLAETGKKGEAISSPAGNDETQSPKSPQPKSMKEIELEVAANTAKFDKEILKKPETELKPKISIKKGKGGVKTATTSANTPEEDEELKQRKAKIIALAALKSNWQPASLMKLIRLIFVILIGAYTGIIQSNNMFF